MEMILSLRSVLLIFFLFINTVNLFGQPIYKATYNFTSKESWDKDYVGIVSCFFNNDSCLIVFEKPKGHKQNILDKGNMVDLSISDNEGMPILLDLINLRLFQRVPYGFLNKMEITDALNRIIWNIEGDTMEIKERLAIKARGSFGGRTYTAWYYPDIPHKVGPWKLHGLPGMIASAYSDDQSIDFDLVNLEKIQNQSSFKLDFILNSKKVYEYFDYFEIQKRYFEKLDEELKRDGGRLFPYGNNKEKQLEKNYIR